MYCYSTVPSGYPHNLESTPHSPTKIYLKWSEVDEIEKNGVITRYEVVFNQSSQPTLSHTGNNTNGTNLSAIVGPLQPFATYNISVRAYTHVGAGPFNPIPIIAMTDPTGVW